MVGSLLQKMLVFEKECFQRAAEKLCPWPVLRKLSSIFEFHQNSFRVHTSFSFKPQDHLLNNIIVGLFLGLDLFVFIMDTVCLWEPVPVNEFACVPHRTWLEDSDRFRFPPLSFCALARDCSGHGGLGAWNLTSQRRSRKKQFEVEFTEIF